ncbi:MAG: META domain-containing protein [Prochlorococcaceae cyanobacterium]
MSRLRICGWSAAMTSSVMVMTAPAMAGTISGTATFRERIALPPDAVFEVVIEDVGRADAPARAIGRQRITPAGQPPFRFLISFRESDLTPRGRYTVRATVRHQGRLLFSTDTITPVLDGKKQPLELLLKQVGAGSAAQRTSPPAPFGALPASWQGDIPGAGGGIRWHVDLAADGTYQLRQSFLYRPQPNQFDDIGRWRLEPGSNRLVLRGGRKAPVFLQPLDDGAALRKLDLEGVPITSTQNDRLKRLPKAAPIDPRLNLNGMFTYMADAASIRLCATGQRLPVAMEGDFLALQRAYLRARPEVDPGQPLLVGLQGLITQRPSMEKGQPPRRTLVVEKFGTITPGKGCQPQLVAPLRGTTWRLLAFGGEMVVPRQPSDRAIELQLSAENLRLTGSAGCNRLMGGFSLEGEAIRFSQLASTRMACSPEVMALEQRYTEALALVRRWSIDKRSLLLQDARGKTLLLFQAGE